MLIRRNLLFDCLFEVELETKIRSLDLKKMLGGIRLIRFQKS